MFHFLFRILVKHFIIFTWFTLGRFYSHRRFLILSVCFPWHRLSFSVFLTRLFRSAYGKLDIGITDPSVKLAREQLPLIRLSCFSCLINLCTRAHKLYCQLLPSTVCAQLFASIRSILLVMDRHVLPAELSQRVESLLNTMERVAHSPTPQFLAANIRLTVLSTEQPEEPRILKTMGLIPQLEPRFDEKYARTIRNSLYGYIYLQHFPVLN